jgi:excisionase family DNA binding protein
MDNTDNIPDPDLREAASRLGVSVDTLRKRIRRHQIQAYKVDGRVYVPLAELSGTVPAVSTDKSPDLSTGPERDSSPDVAFLQAAIERLWGELRERDALIERLTTPLTLPAPTVGPVGPSGPNGPENEEAPPLSEPKRRWRFWSWWSWAQ